MMRAALAWLLEEVSGEMDLIQEMVLRPLWLRHVWRATWETWGAD